MNIDKSSLQRYRRKAETLFTQEGRPEMKHMYLFIVEPGCKHNFYEILTLRRLMSYVYMAHPFLMFLDHTQRRTTVGRTPLDE